MNPTKSALNPKPATEDLPARTWLSASPNRWSDDSSGLPRHRPRVEDLGSGCRFMVWSSGSRSLALELRLWVQDLGFSTRLKLLELWGPGASRRIMRSVYVTSGMTQDLGDHTALILTQ